jgi:hypothetical protein
VLRWTLLNLFVMAPLLVYVAIQVPGIAIRYECTNLEKRIVQARLERRRLLAERERLLAPERLRREAELRGLVPPALAERPEARTAPRLRGAGR